MKMMKMLVIRLEAEGGQWRFQIMLNKKKINESGRRKSLKQISRNRQEEAGEIDTFFFSSFLHHRRRRGGEVELVTSETTSLLFICHFVWQNEAGEVRRRQGEGDERGDERSVRPLRAFFSSALSLYDITGGGEEEGRGNDAGKGGGWEMKWSWLKIFSS